MPLITSDEMKFNSKLNTEKELKKLGNLEQIRKNKINLFLNLKKEYNDFLNIFPQNSDEKLNQYLSKRNNSSNIVTLINLIKLSKKFNEVINSHISKITEQNKTLKKENIELKNNLNKYIKLEDQLENRIENYWEPRVLKLRNKCIEKNNLFKRYNKFLLGFIFLLFISTIFLTRKNLFCYLELLIEPIFSCLSFILIYLINLLLKFSLFPFNLMVLFIFIYYFYYLYNWICFLYLIIKVYK